MQPEEAVHLRDYVHVLKKRKWTTIVCFVIVVSTVTIASFKARPVYKATAQILIERENPNVVSIQEVLAIDAASFGFYQTQYELLKSEMLARRVIKKLNLEGYPDFSRPEPRGSGWFGSKGSELPPEKPMDRERRIIGEFLKKLSVRPIRNSRLVKVSFESFSPELAAGLANGLAEEFIAYNLELKLN
ncbi:MAG TPA: Wzz/FepE/Etk N-terminal domain-containing protein, partial [Nitrospiria bacterium]|nr:Wzz/FepE/Etk N-terminal domain-containing protein [Nitrospiria bacterium]